VDVQFGAGVLARWERSGVADKTASSTPSQPAALTAAEPAPPGVAGTRAVGEGREEPRRSRGLQATRTARQSRAPRLPEVSQGSGTAGKLILERRCCGTEVRSPVRSRRNRIGRSEASSLASKRWFRDRIVSGSGPAGGGVPLVRGSNRGTTGRRRRRAGFRDRRGENGQTEVQLQVGRGSHQAPSISDEQRSQTGRPIGPFPLCPQPPPHPAEAASPPETDVARRRRAEVRQRLPRRAEARRQRSQPWTDRPHPRNH
jgi:hypothetical protein